MSLSPLPTAGAAVMGSSTEDEAAALRPVIRAVVAYVLRAHRDHPDVEDLTHEALRRALEGRHRLRAGEPLRPWVLGIARHVALDALRSRRRAQRTMVSVGEDHAPVLDGVADSAPDPYERAAGTQMAQHLSAALAELDEGPRRALLFFHIEGLGYQDIATRLGVPIGTVATWIARSRKRLAERLPGLEAGGGAPPQGGAR